MLVSFKRWIQQRVGLDRPYFKLMQIPMQFFKLFAKMVVRDGSSSMLGGDGMSFMILNRLVLAIFRFVSKMLSMVSLRESFGIGSRWRVIGIFEPQMLRVFPFSMQSSMSASKRMSAFSLCVEKANPIMLFLLSLK